MRSNNAETKSVCPSVLSMLDRVMQQVEYPCFADIHTGRIDPVYKELCLIISEILIMPPDCFIKINGSEVQTRLVQEVYEQLRNDHLRLVLENFQEVNHKVYNKKAYMRTALYNAVFELETHYTNDLYSV